MARIPDSVIDEVRTRADIVAVIGRYVTLRKAGRQYLGLCPFHGEKTPSFQVSLEKQVFYCFGCQESGNVLSFLMKHNGLEFPEAVGVLARELGVALPERGEAEGRSVAVYRANDAALEYFRSALRSAEGAAARAYLIRRGVPEDLIERFQIGFAPARWDGLLGHLRGDKQLREAALAAGLLKQRETGEGCYDAFRGRVVFPIAEPGGRLLGFGGRALSEDGPKYINSAESAVYHKSRVLFGLPLALDAIRKQGRAIVVEGYFDVLGLHRAGLAEAVAPCGTALTEEHARRLHRYAPEVLLLFDGDDAGQRAAERCLPILLAEGLRVRAAFLPAGEDPDSLVQKSGAVALRAAVDAAEPLLDHLIERTFKGAMDPRGAADATQKLAPFIRAIPDPVERAAYQRRLASYLQLPADVLAAAIGAPEGAASTVRAGPRRKASAGDLDPVVRTLLGAALASPAAARHLERVQHDWIPEGINRELYCTLAQAISIHGQGAAAHLLSPENTEVTPEIAERVAHIAALDLPGDPQAAEQAAGDCVRHLEMRTHDARIRCVKAQLESCTDPQQGIALLEQLQQHMALRKERGAGIAGT